jgi:2,3-bisphosphoglycerate-dependent phosphoglycerate mutase
MRGKLILVRHHESEWNKLGKWTGKTDVLLTEYGKEKSREMGQVLKGIKVDYAFSSMLTRAIETMSFMLLEMEISEVKKEYSDSLNERDYGIYTGKNKWEMKELVGDMEWNNIRRGWDHKIPEGETLKMVYERTIPYFLEKIFPKLDDNKNVLIVAHGNSLRSIFKYIENISDEEIGNLEFPFGQILIYDLDDNAHIVKKEIYQIKSEVNA